MEDTDQCPRCSTHLDSRKRCPACWSDVLGLCDECDTILQENGICENGCIQFEAVDERLYEYEGDANECYIKPSHSSSQKKMNPLELLINSLNEMW